MRVKTDLGITGQFKKCLHRRYPWTLPLSLRVPFSLLILNPKREKRRKEKNTRPENHRNTQKRKRSFFPMSFVSAVVVKKGS